jgi:hypothetical protein
VKTVGSSDPVVTFGFGFAVAVVVIAFVDAMTVLIPDLEEEADWLLGPAWLYMGLLGIVLFAVFGFAGMGSGQERRRTALAVIVSTVLGGLLIAGMAARAGLSGSF